MISPEADLFPRPCLTAAWLFVWLVGMAGGPASADELTVATFNINYANRSPPRMVAALREAAADIVFVQETTDTTERLLAREFRGSHPHRLFLGDEGRYFAERSGVLSRYPLRNIRFVPPVDGGLFGTLLLETTIDGRTVQLANVHLTPFQVRRGGLPDVLRAMGQTEVVHAAEAARIVDSLPGDAPVLVCGDFNSLAEFQAPSRMRGAGWIDSFAAVTPAADEHPTWHWPAGGGQLRFRIDYIFHSSHFETLSARVIPTTTSDHHLLVSRIRLRPAP